MKKEDFKKSKLPETSGVYFFLDKKHTGKNIPNRKNVLYIGKTYANCSYHFKDRGTKTVEVLITNYGWEEPKCEQMTLML